MCKACPNEDIFISSSNWFHDSLGFTYVVRTYAESLRNKERYHEIRV
jgi:hypothetical protein